MLTIEEYLDRAKYIGRIQGMAETIEDEATRDGLYGDAEYLFGYLVEDATNDDNERNNALHRLQEEAITPELLIDYPPFTDDIITQTEDTATTQKQTNLDWLYHHPKELADLITCPYHECPHMDEADVGGENVCKPCAVNWLKEKHTDD